MASGKSGGKGLLGFVSNAVGHNHSRIEVEFTHPDTNETVPTIRLKAQGQHAAEEMPLYVRTDNTKICGQVKIISSQAGGKLDHLGVRAQLLGTIELRKSGVKHHQFLSLTRELAPAGETHSEQTLPFEFNNVDASMDSYRGHTVRLRYVLKVTVSKSVGGFNQEFPLWVQNPCTALPTEEPIKLEVGIENCLHLEFTYSSSVYGVQDCVLGSVHFKLVKINLKTMELEVRRKEITTTDSKVVPDIQTLYKFEIMDGAPVRGEVLPVRLYLKPLELSPSYEAVQNKFSIKYFLNLVLVDSEDRRYFKQHEITLIRRP